MVIIMVMKSIAVAPHPHHHCILSRFWRNSPLRNCIVRTCVRGGGGWVYKRPFLSGTWVAFFLSAHTALIFGVSKNFTLCDLMFVVLCSGREGGVGGEMGRWWW